jgi:hypothetical protein
MNDHDALEAVRHAARWFSPTADGLAPLLDLIGDARIVLIRRSHAWDGRVLSALGSTRDLTPTGV